MWTADNCIGYDDSRFHVGKSIFITDFLSCGNADYCIPVSALLQFD